MRDPNRIDPILARLRAAWIASPDLRLGQLIIGSLPTAWPASRLGRFARLFNAECSEFGAVNAPIVWPVDADALDRSGCARRMDDRDKLIATLVSKLAEAKRLGIDACALTPFSRETNERALAIGAALEAL